AAVDDEELGLGRGIHLALARLPAHPAVERQDVGAAQDDVAARAGPERDRLVARDRHALGMAMAVVDFKDCHADGSSLGDSRSSSSVWGGRGSRRAAASIWLGGSLALPGPFTPWSRRST